MSFVSFGGHGDLGSERCCGSRGFKSFVSFGRQGGESLRRLRSQLEGFGELCFPREAR